MKLLSDDDLDLAEMSDEELAAAWDLWFDLAQATNDDDPPWTHGVFVGMTLPAPGQVEIAELALAEDAEDLAAFGERSGEPDLPFESVVRELGRSGKI